MKRRLIYLSSLTLTVVVNLTLASAHGKGGEGEGRGGPPRLAGEGVVGGVGGVLRKEDTGGDMGGECEE